ncbi:MAG TPA: hypothetical protein VKA60_16420 [Blastocatellia bacterium]|nr:hypothetical protein [Blastocatellia bacterium]
MKSDIFIQIVSIVVQNAAYLSCLTWLAWRGERRLGGDAFHLVVAYAAAIWSLSFLVNKLSVPAATAVILVSIIGFLIDLSLGLWVRGLSDQRLLVQVITVALLTLIAFDWATSHTPVSLPVGSASLANLALTCALGVWVLIALHSRSRAGMVLRLGVRNHWAMEYWGRPLPAASVLQVIVAFLCWVPISTIPMITSGLLSSTILKDVAIAILIARVNASRGPLILLAICVMLAALRTGIAFVFVNNAGPPLVEAAVFVCLLVWLRYRGSRTAWRETDGR